MTALGVIPARWASTRFPGKILAPLLGRPMIAWVVEAALKAQELDEVLVATDDSRIVDALHSAGVEVVMTRSDHPSGTDRIAEAVQSREADVVVNIQGDEPLVEAQLIDQLVLCLEDDSWDMATACAPLTDLSQRSEPSVVKVVRAANGRALYFSRACIPHVRTDRTVPAGDLYWRHVGLYAYRRGFLDRFIQAPPCAMEEAEGLEQLRALYIGASIIVIETADESIGVDTPDDLKYVESILSAQSDSGALTGGGRTHV